MRDLPPLAPDTPSIPELREAVLRLGPDSERRFGTMTPAQMLQHAGRFIELYLGRVPVSLPVRWIARLLGPLFLGRVVRKSPLDTPKGLSTLPGIKSAEDGLDLDRERATFLDLLSEIEALEGPQRHVLYGRMEARAIQDLVRHHTAHHFHQFGLLEGGSAN